LTDPFRAPRPGAEKKVEGEINAEFRRVHGKNGILAKLATAALALPEEIVRKVLYPVAGKRTLEDIIAVAKANEKQFIIRVRTKLRGSYSHHYRRGLPRLLKAVTFGSSNEAFQPVMDALALLGGTPTPKPTSTTLPTRCRWSTWCPRPGLSWTVSCRVRRLLVRGTYSKRALFPELVTSLDDDPVAGPCGEACAELDEHPGTDCEC
jgi:hypothetical protein